MHTSTEGLLPWLMTAVLTEMPVVVEAENDLIRQAQHDLRKFTHLYDRYVQRVYRYLLVRTGSQTDAEDLTSQTFMAAMENLHQFKGQRPFAAWLLGIAKNKRADFYRKQKAVMDLDTAVDLPDFDDPGPDELVNRQLQIEWVARKLQTIAPDRAEALSLRLFAGLEIPEIARFMDKQEAAVRMLIHRGLQDLKAQLNPNWEEQA